MWGEGTFEMHLGEWSWELNNSLLPQSSIDNVSQYRGKHKNTYMYVHVFACLCVSVFGFACIFVLLFMRWKFVVCLCLTRFPFPTFRVRLFQSIDIV